MAEGYTKVSNCNAVKRNFTVDVPANGRIEKSLAELGITDINSSSVLGASICIGGAGASAIIPWFSGVPYSYVTFYNLANVDRTIGGTITFYI